MGSIFNAQQIVNGLQLGSIYALIALGYTMVYGIVRLINFAHGDFYMLGAFAAYGAFYMFNASLGTGGLLAFVVLILAMAGSGGIALIANRFAYKPLRYKPRLSSLVTAIGVSMFLEYFFSALPVIGPNPRGFPEIIPKRMFTVGSAEISNYVVIDLAVAAVLMVGLTLLIQRSSLGRAMRAVSQDKDAAKLMGIDVERIISATFLIGGAFAGAAGLLAGMTYPRIQPYMGILPGLKAFIAAVLGGIGNIPGAVLGAYIMGLAETFATSYNSLLGEGIAFVILIVVLLVRPTGILGEKVADKIKPVEHSEDKRRHRMGPEETLKGPGKQPARGGATGFRLPRLTAFAAVLYAVIQILSATGVLNGYFMIIINRSLVFVILAVSLNLINGITGQFSLGHMGFAAVGAYMSGAITTLIFKFPPERVATLGGNTVFLVAILAGGLAAAVVGFLIGFPSLRLKGDYLAIVTLGFGEIIRTILNNIDAVGGPRGLLGIPKFSNFTSIFVFTFLTIVVLRNLVQSSHGRAMLSIRENELAAELAGVNTTRYKVTGFAIGAFFAGVAGGLLAHLLQIAHPTQYGFYPSALVLIMVYAGGMGSLTGSIIAAFGLTFLTEALRVGIDWLKDTAHVPVGTEWTMVVYALLLILIMLFRTEGLMGTREAKILMIDERKP